MKTWTFKEMLNEGPCYTENELRQIWGDKETYTILEILQRDDLSDSDKLWCAYRITDQRVIDKFYIAIERQLNIEYKTYFRLNDERSIWSIVHAAIIMTSKFSLNSLTAMSRMAALDAVVWGKRQMVKCLIEILKNVYQQ